MVEKRILLASKYKWAGSRLKQQLQQALETHCEGLSIIDLNDGKSVLRELKERRYDAVFLEVDLPKISGYDILKKINPYEREIPVIIMPEYYEVKEDIDLRKIGAVEQIMTGLPTLRSIPSSLTYIAACAKRCLDAESFKDLLPPQTEGTGDVDRLYRDIANSFRIKDRQFPIYKLSSSILNRLLRESYPKLLRNKSYVSYLGQSRNVVYQFFSEDFNLILKCFRKSGLSDHRDREIRRLPNEAGLIDYVARFLEENQDKYGAGFIHLPKVYGWADCVYGFSFNALETIVDKENKKRGRTLYAILRDSEGNYSEYYNWFRKAHTQLSRQQNLVSELTNNIRDSTFLHHLYYHSSYFYEETFLEEFKMRFLDKVDIVDKRSGKCMDKDMIFAAFSEFLHDAYGKILWPLVSMGFLTTSKDFSPVNLVVRDNDIVIIDWDTVMHTFSQMDAVMLNDYHGSRLRQGDTLIEGDDIKLFEEVYFPEMKRFYESYYPEDHHSKKTGSHTVFEHFLAGYGVIGIFRNATHAGNMVNHYANPSVSRESIDELALRDHPWEGKTAQETKHNARAIVDEYSHNSMRKAIRTHDTKLGSILDNKLKGLLAAYIRTFPDDFEVVPSKSCLASIGSKQ